MSQAPSSLPETAPQAETSSAAAAKTKKKILSAMEYACICKFANNYYGLAIDCELEMLRKFSDIEPLALTCILQTEIRNNNKSQPWRSEHRTKKLLQTYEEQCHLYADNSLLTRMSVIEGISPVAICRLMLHKKDDFRQKTQVSRLLKYPHLIKDPCLAANVQQCLCSDNQEGPITDLRRRIIGEEYELKMKQLAQAAGLYYYDEHDLRRLGYDKTPDIKMILPFLYKGKVVNWIESKANFADPKSHIRNIQLQLHSYCNRFGPGIVIYWFGYHEETPQLSENNIGITVLSDFPAAEHMELLNLTEKETSVPATPVANADSSNKS